MYPILNVGIDPQERNHPSLPIRVVRDLKSAQNPRYKALLNKALRDLDAQLAAFAGN